MRVRCPHAGKDLKGEKQKARKHLLRTQAFTTAALRDSGCGVSGSEMPMLTLVRKLQVQRFFPATRCCLFVAVPEV